MAKQAAAKNITSGRAKKHAPVGTVAVFRPARDPVIDALDRTKRAWDTFSEVCGITDEVVYPGRTPAQQANAEKIWQLAYDQWWAELQCLLKARPSTMAGLVALIEYLAEFYERYEQHSIRNPRIEPRFFNAIAGAARAAAQAGAR